MKIIRELTLSLLLMAPLAAQDQVVELTSEPPGALVVVDHLWPFTSFGAVLCICLKQITTRELNWAS